MDAPLFRSVHDAMVFATNFNYVIAPRSTMNQMLAPSTGSGKGLSGLDGAGQAGIILAELGRLDGLLHASCIFLRTAPRSVPCSCGAPCCSGKIPNWDYLEHEASLIRKLWDLQKAASKEGKRGPADLPELRRILIRKYFGAKFTVQDIASKCDISDSTVASHYTFIKPTLKKAECDGFHQLDTKLRDLGIVGELP